MARELEDEPDPISTPGERRGNGRKWFRETWGKALGGALTVLIVYLSIKAWIGAVALKDATVEVYGLPPRVLAVEAKMKALETRHEMTPEEVKTLAGQIADELAKKRKP